MRTPEQGTPKIFGNSQVVNETNWTLVLKIGSQSDTLGFSSGLWTNTELLNTDSPVEEQADAKYDSYLSEPFTTIRMCVGSPTGACVTHNFRQGFRSARELFSAGYIRDESVYRDGILDAFGVPVGSYQACPMQRPGFNIECVDGNKARWGFCLNCVSQTCQNDDSDDADAAIGIGLAGQATSSEIGAGWTSHFAAAAGSCMDNIPTYRSVWLWVRRAAVVAVPIPWTAPVIDVSALPPARELSSSVVTASGVMWIFGGAGDPDLLNDLWYRHLQVPHSVWVQVTTLHRPSARTGHSAVVSPAGLMWVFGGGGGWFRETDGFRLNDLWHIDLESPSPSWTEVNVPIAPSARYRHTAVLSSGRMWVFGGLEITYYLNDLWSMDLTDLTDLEALRWAEASTFGEPEGRASHTAVILDGVMWVHGGYTAGQGADSAISELWSIDLEARPLVWSEVPSDSLLARAGHRGVVTNGALWFFGGATAYWERHEEMSCIDLEAVPPRQGILSVPKGPDARWQPESVVTAGLFVVFGGYVNGPDNDLWTLNIASSTCTWATQERPGMWTRTSLLPRPSSRNAHGAALGPNASMWIFGGWDGSTVGDLWSLGLEDSPEAPMEWMQASVSSPGSFYNPVTVVTENLLWLFGGYGDGPHCGGWSNQLYSIDLSASSLAWTDHGGYGYPRNKHSGVVTSTGVMWVFGGNLCREYYSTDDVGHFISIDLRAQVLSYASHSSYNEPSWRKEHSAVVTAAGVMWLFGGDDESTRLSDLYSIDLNASPLVWAEYVLAGPAARSGHSAALRGGEMWIFGGQAKDGSYYNVPWFIDVEATTLMWVEVLSSGSNAADVPVGRHRTSTVIAAGALWVLGGWGAGGLLDELWSMQTESTTTSTTSSSSSTTSTHYTPCPAGSYKIISDAPCEPCPIGKFNNETGALSLDACQDCPVGSITRDEGANHVDLCVRPLGTHSLECVSGQVCAVSLNGFSLQDGHQLAMLSSGCAGTALQVPNVPDSGVSKTATQEGRLYVWGEASTDFTPEGGFYSLCWCPNMHERMCAELQDFQFSAGQLKVSGPLSNHFFQCARGQDCKALGPVQGVDLSTQDQAGVSKGGPLT